MHVPKPYSPQAMKSEASRVTLAARTEYMGPNQMMLGRGANSIDLTKLGSNKMIFMAECNVILELLVHGEQFHTLQSAMKNHCGN